MKTDIQKCLEIYQEQLNDGYIQTAYIAITKYVTELKRYFDRYYSVSSVGLGYLDYTYFYFTNDHIKEKNLKYALVFNHEKLQFELWLCARVAQDKKRYWNLLIESKWNKNKKVMPKYGIIEITLDVMVDFDDQEKMSKSIIAEANQKVLEIENYLKQIDL
ncbi:MAG: hypothetical protein MR210_01805 [Erysipelotrichaceae bacterium]|nr:hypothetical protein [Erysipelotrichaceae bacterium]MDY5251402.1 hypothetical protein [Erysipelotrichaceae bacterium]